MARVFALALLAPSTVAQSLSGFFGWVRNGYNLITSTTLTITYGVSQASAVWSPSSLDTSSSWTASYRLTLTAPSSTTYGGADGVAFVVHADPRAQNALGTEGGNIGLLGRGPTSTVAPAVAFVLEDYDLISGGIWNSSMATLPTTSLGPKASTGTYFRVTVAYCAASSTFSASVYRNAGSSSIYSGTMNVSLASFLGQTAYVGFTGGTGGLAWTHTLTGFSLTATSGSCTCNPGERTSGSTCIACAAGEYSTVGTVSTWCVSTSRTAARSRRRKMTPPPPELPPSSMCAAGTYSAAGASACTPCAAGLYSSTAAASTCAVCAARYVSAAGATSCTYNAASPYSSSCSTCTAASFWWCADTSSCTSLAASCSSAAATVAAQSSCPSNGGTAAAASESSDTASIIAPILFVVASAIFLFRFLYIRGKLPCFPRATSQAAPADAPQPQQQQPYPQSQPPQLPLPQPHPQVAYAQSYPQVAYAQPYASSAPQVAYYPPGTYPGMFPPQILYAVAPPPPPLPPVVSPASTTLAFVVHAPGSLHLTLDPCDGSGGAVVSGVLEDSELARAGIRVGDRLAELGGEVVFNAFFDDIITTIQRDQAKRPLEVKVVRPAAAAAANVAAPPPTAEPSVGFYPPPVFVVREPVAQ